MDNVLPCDALSIAGLTKIRHDKRKWEVGWEGRRQAWSHLVEEIYGQWAHKPFLREGYTVEVAAPFQPLLFLVQRSMQESLTDPFPSEFIPAEVNNSSFQDGCAIHQNPRI